MKANEPESKGEFLRSEKASEDRWRGEDRLK